MGRGRAVVVGGGRESVSAAHLSSLLGRQPSDLLFAGTRKSHHGGLLIGTRIKGSGVLIPPFNYDLA